MDIAAPTNASPLRPVTALLAQPDPAALAVITGTEGPSYRPVGAIMAVTEGLTRIGSLSSGCVESDIALHAEAAWQAGRPAIVRYGLGSPFKDITLPCGGGLDIMLVPNPDRAVLAALRDAHDAREMRLLAISCETGALALREKGETGWDGDTFLTRIDPELQFLVFGKGPEASTFAALAQAAGYLCTLLSPDDETLQAAEAAGCGTRHLTSPGFPEDIVPDARTAITLFFHDHEWEPPILGPALESPAFYVGAQGSLAARATRDAELAALGVPASDISRMKGPIGLIRSARDARTLAVSVLSEVLANLQGN